MSLTKKKNRSECSDVRKRYQCLNGTCVNHYSQCESRNPICPYFRPYWCADIKLCVISDEDCLRTCFFKQNNDVQAFKYRCNGYRKCAKYPNQCPEDCFGHDTYGYCPQDGICVNNITLCTSCADWYRKRCVRSARCYPQMQYCDGIKDCDDGSDEMNCYESRGQPVLEQWMIAAAVFSVFVILVIFATYFSYMKRKRMRQRARRESQQIVNPETGSQPLMRFPRPDRLTSHLGEESQVQTTNSVPPPFANLYQGPQARSAPTHMQMDFGDQQLPPAYPGRQLNSNHGARWYATNEMGTFPPDTDNERGVSPPPSYFDAVTNTAAVITVTADDVQLPTYDETVHADLEDRIKQQESHV